MQMGLLPLLIKLRQRLKQFSRQRFISKHVAHVQNRLGDPTAVGLYIPASFQPEAQVIFRRVALISKPSRLPKMKSKSAVNGVVFSRPRHLRQKFADQLAFRRAEQMFAKCPPAVIINPLQFLPGAAEQRNVPLCPSGCGSIVHLSHV